jgi:hypothetical protein
MSENDQKAAIESWNIEGPRREAERLRMKKGEHIPEEELEKYHSVLAKLKALLAPPPVPAMPILGQALSISAEGHFSEHAGGDPSPGNKRRHQDKIATKGHSAETYALVHAPISMKKAMKIPKAKKAVDDEWYKLGVTKPSWDLNSVKARKDVKASARSRGVTTHFGELMDLCHLKHAELAEALQSYKGRVVFRGDTMRDEDGFLAVFSEQGASASSMAASKVLDAIGRFPGNDSEDSDALGAYTQVLLKDVYKLLGCKPEDIPEIWIKLPRDQRPAWWDTIEDPVCLLTRNLYGHPLAGLIWEKHGEKAIVDKCGFEKVKGWECL